MQLDKDFFRKLKPEPVMSEQHYLQTKIRELQSDKEELLQSVRFLQTRLDILISATPTGKRRDLFTEDNIKTLILIKKHS